MGREITYEDTCCAAKFLNEVAGIKWADIGKIDRRSPRYAWYLAKAAETEDPDEIREKAKKVIIKKYNETIQSIQKAQEAERLQRDAAREARVRAKREQVAKWLSIDVDG